MRKDLGDFQTPASLVSEVIDCLHRQGQRWSRALEPTCGVGGFIKGLIDSPSPPDEIVGFEIQEQHLEQALQLTQSSRSTRVDIRKANVFALDFNKDIEWQTSGPLLVIGNPPWVTNSALGVSGGSNLPRKSNLKKLRGIEAITGSSNFDIAEFIWIKLITELADARPTIAMLCKMSVARNVLQYSYDNALRVNGCWLRRIDAKKHFRAAVDACLFCVELGHDNPCYETPVFGDLYSNHPQIVMGFARGRLVSDIQAYNKVEFADSNCLIAWRQGIKHDAAQVMELEREAARFRNRKGDAIDVESEYVYPLMKSSDLFHQNSAKPRLSVIVTQKRIGDDTHNIEAVAPRLWRYLNSHREVFDCRKSSIYRGKSPFAIFGIGDYSFARFKVAVSGLHKEPRFRLVVPVEDRPVMLDDTSYFLPCESIEQAALIAAILNHDTTQRFIRSTMFSDAKRPITKRLLQRIDLIAVLNSVDKEFILKAAEEELAGSHYRFNSTAHQWPDDLTALLRA